MLQRNWTHRADLQINMNLDGRAAVISIARNLKLVWSTVAPAILQTSFEQPTGGKQSPVLKKAILYTDIYRLWRPLVPIVFQTSVGEGHRHLLSRINLN